MEKTNYPTNLIDAVFGGSKTIVAVDVKRIPEWLDNLSYREKAVVKMRYEDGKTLEEIGKEFNVTRERIRQVEAQALKRLSHPSNIKDVACVSFSDYMEMQKALTKEINELRHQYMTLRGYTDSLEMAIAKEIPSLTRILRTLPESHKSSSNPLPDLLLEDMGLSARAFNCLKRAGYTTASEVAEQDLSEMITIRNLGASSMQEVSDKLKEFGFDPKF